MTQLSIVFAFAAGLLSFFSPCLLPILPGFIIFMSGTASGEKPDRLKLFLSSVAFVVGFGAVFIAFGLALNGILGGASSDVKNILSRVGGIVVIIFGLFLMGVFHLPMLESEYKLSPIRTRWQYLTSALFGATFAAGWSPCVGAVLGSVLALAATDSSSALPLMLAYTAGLAIPFIFIGALGIEFSRLLSKFRGGMKNYNFAVGLLLVAIGILMATGLLAQLSSFLAQSGFPGVG